MDKPSFDQLGTPIGMSQVSEIETILDQIKAYSDDLHQNEITTISSSPLESFQTVYLFHLTQTSINGTTQPINYSKASNIQIVNNPQNDWSMIEINGNQVTIYFDENQAEEVRQDGFSVDSNGLELTLTIQQQAASIGWQPNGLHIQTTETLDEQHPVSSLDLTSLEQTFTLYIWTKQSRMINGSPTSETEFAPVSAIQVSGSDQVTLGTISGNACTFNLSENEGDARVLSLLLTSVDVSQPFTVNQAASQIQWKDLRIHVQETDTYSEQGNISSISAVAKETQPKLLYAWLVQEQYTNGEAEGIYRQIAPTGLQATGDAISTPTVQVGPTNATISVLVAENQTESPREGTIHFTLNSLTHDVTVSQSAGVVEWNNTSLHLQSTNVYDADAVMETISVPATASQGDFYVWLIQTQSINGVVQSQTKAVVPTGLQATSSNPFTLSVTEQSGYATVHYSVVENQTESPIETSLNVTLDSLQQAVQFSQQAGVITWQTQSLHVQTTNTFDEGSAISEQELVSTASNIVLYVFLKQEKSINGVLSGETRNQAASTVTAPSVDFLTTEVAANVVTVSYSENPTEETRSAVLQITSDNTVAQVTFNQDSSVVKWIAIGAHIQETSELDEESPSVSAVSIPATATTKHLYCWVKQKEQRNGTDTGQTRFQTPTEVQAPTVGFITTSVSGSDITCTIVENPDTAERSDELVVSIDSQIVNVAFTQAATVREWRTEEIRVFQEDNPETEQVSTVQIPATQGSDMFYVYKYQQQYVNDVPNGSYQTVAFVNPQPIESDFISCEYSSNFFQASWEENTTEQEREATVVINDGEVTKNVIFHQAAATVEWRTESIKVLDADSQDADEVSSVSVPATGSVTDMYVYLYQQKYLNNGAEGQYQTIKATTVTAPTVGIAESVVDTNHVQVTVGNNTTESTREASLVITSDSKTATITFNQAAGAVTWRTDSLKIQDTETFDSGEPNVTEVEVPNTGSVTELYVFLVQTKLVGGVETDQTQTVAATTVTAPTVGIATTQVSGNHITVTVAQNNASDTKNAVLVITSDSKEANVTFNQAAGQEVWTTQSIVATTTSAHSDGDEITELSVANSDSTGKIYVWQKQTSNFSGSRVIAATGVNASSAQTWCTITNNESDFDYQVTANTANTRSSVLTIQANSKQVQVTINQAAAVETWTTTEIVFTPNSVYFQSEETEDTQQLAYTGGSETLYVWLKQTSNLGGSQTIAATEFNVTSNPTWVQVTNNGSNIVVTAEANSDVARQEAIDIQVGTINAELWVNQRAVNDDWVDEELIFCGSNIYSAGQVITNKDVAAEGTGESTNYVFCFVRQTSVVNIPSEQFVEANPLGSYSSNQEWVTLSAFGNYAINNSVAANDGEQRVATITVHYKELQGTYTITQAASTTV